MQVDTGQFRALSEQVEGLSARVEELEAAVRFRQAYESEMAAMEVGTGHRQRGRHLRLLHGGAR
jgi:hypothetical protein